MEGVSISSTSQASALIPPVRGSSVEENNPPNCLELMDIEALVAAQDKKMNFTTDGHHLGRADSIDVVILGGGYSYSVTRISSRGIMGNTYPRDNRLSTSKEFVVVKSPRIDKTSSEADDFQQRLYAVMLELRILHHKPVREHPNIVRLLEFMWDTQNHASKVAPSLILEFADLGTLSDFQDPERLSLRATTKIDICLDVAEGLSFLHKCGIIHGDVKSKNVLLFRTPSAKNIGGLGIRAKLSDFGCSLIEVFNDDSGKKQKLPGRTIPWDAPESFLPMNVQGLRRTDIYSYGMLVWQVMCNGIKPFEYLAWDQDRRLAEAVPSSSEKPLTKLEKFLALKSLDNLLLLFAKDSLLGRHNSDVQLGTVEAVLDLTLQLDPERRAKDMDEIVMRLKTQDSGSFNTDPIVAPEYLAKGDFGISSPLFPIKIYWLRNSPPTFRSIICKQLERDSMLAATPAKQSLASLALAVCYGQGLYTTFEGENVVRTSDSLVGVRTVEALLNSAKMGNALAQSIIPGVCRAHGQSSMAHSVPLADWLVSSVRHGSIRARNELMAVFPKKLEETIHTIALRRESLAKALPLESCIPVDAVFIERFPDLDPAAKATLTQPRIELVHQAAFLGSLEVLNNLIKLRQDIFARTPGGETALHYAAQGGHSATIKLLIEAGIEINAQSQHGATSLHFALLSPCPERVVAVLLEHRADPNILSLTTLEGLPARCDYFLPADGSPLHFAVVCENINVARALLDAGAKPNLKSQRGMTPLQSVLQNQSISLLKLLLPYATHEITDLPNPHSMYAFLTGQYLTPMMKTLIWTRNPNNFIEEAMNSFRENGIDLDARGILAAGFDANDAVIVDYFLRKLGDGNEKGITPFRCRQFYNDGTTAAVDLPLLSDSSVLLDMIITTSRPEIIKSVLRYVEKPLNSKGDSSEPSGLCRLASRPMTTPDDMMDVVKALLDHGADLSAPKARNEGPIHWAAVFNNYHALDALLMFNAALGDVRDAMHTCIQKGNSWAATRMLRSIWRKRPEVLLPLDLNHCYIPSKSTSAPDLSLIDKNYLSILCGTLEHGRDDNLNESSLLAAVQSLKSLPDGKKALRRLFDEENNNILMYTPLHHAANTGNLNAVKILIGEGANVNFSGKPHPSLPESIARLELPASDLEDDIFDETTAVGRGLTPLDVALARNWHTSVYIWPQWDRPAIQAIRNAGGSHAEERRYDQRTAETVELLREKGAKTRAELFNLPEPVIVANKARQEDIRKRFEAREISRTGFASDSRIMNFFAESCKLPSMQVTVAKFPGLVTNMNPDRPKLSSLFKDAITIFWRLVNVDTWCDGNVQQFEHMQSACSLLASWITKNGVENGDIDMIQHTLPPSKSVQLAASIFICVCEILQVLQMLQKLSSKSWRSKDYAYRVDEFLADLDTAIATLTMEQLDLVQLSKMANAELKQFMDTPSIFAHPLPSSAAEYCPV